MSIAETALPDLSPLDQLGEDVYDDGYLRIEHKNYYLACGGHTVYLPRTEFLLISRLARSVERTVPAEELWRYARGNEKPFNSESLHVFMYRLRGKLTPYGLHIDTMVNVGYRLLLAEPQNSTRLQ
ncbi:MAG TPA: winged helix-turn-helix domain-containing protein [Pyrinomonadaceae bacterium]|nr:winged helix-turn-helix domain-containing protein [Pyrinomonadaceae bacterium]HZF40207.1 winged helix-turn-helix domain-containing protein [Blastocatellia bacterium]